MNDAPLADGSHIRLPPRRFGKMATCVYCGNDVHPASAPRDMTLTADDGSGVYCPDPSALGAPGPKVGQNATHSTSPLWAP
jgi:hypothetical protein